MSYIDHHWRVSEQRSVAATIPRGWIFLLAGLAGWGVVWGIAWAAMRLFG
jgi:hypothetical protein